MLPATRGLGQPRWVTPTFPPASPAVSTTAAMPSALLDALMRWTVRQFAPQEDGPTTRSPNDDSVDGGGGRGAVGVRRNGVCSEYVCPFVAPRHLPSRRR